MFSSSQIQALFYHSRNKTQAFHGNLDTKSVREAITLHPVKQPSYMYRLHSHFMTLRTHDFLRRAIQETDRQLDMSARLFPTSEEKTTHQDVRAARIWDMFNTQKQKI